MQSVDIKVVFSTPAFLGNAEQSGQWRTPPFKAQLRQWWRVTYAASKHFQPNVAAMREAEGRLFGHAWLEHDSNKRGDKVSARKSTVRIRLGQWREGSLPKGKWAPLAKVNHPEAPAAAADLYLGYGPVTLPRGERSPTLKANAAIQAGEHTMLSLAFPEQDAFDLIEQALYLMHRFGTVGGRSRNGWGSYALMADEGAALVGTLPLRDWKDCLQLDWPHAIGQDAKGALIWQTQPCADWKVLMKQLAELKIGLRTQFALSLDASAGDKQLYDKRGNEQGINHGLPQHRHWLSYPVTNHSVKPWDNRLPNSLRFKACPTTDGQLVGLIFHMPCLPPASFKPDLAAIQRVWQQVHGFLDMPVQQLTRIKA